jgi:hypothetical protein
MAAVRGSPGACLPVKAEELLQAQGENQTLGQREFWGLCSRSGLQEGSMVVLQA